MAQVGGVLHDPALDRHGTGTVITVRGKDKLTIADPRLHPGPVLGVLGPKPPNADLKKGILAQD